MNLHANEVDVVVEGIENVTDIGELAKLATKLPATAVIEKHLNDEGDPTGSYDVRIIFDTDDELDIIVGMTLLRAYTRGLSGDGVLAELRAAFSRRHFPLDRPIQDVMEIGGGSDHEGHEH